MFPALGKVTLCNRCPGGPNSTFPLTIRAICSGCPPVWAAWVLFVVGVAPILAGSQVLLYEVATDLLRAGSGPKVVSCGTLGHQAGAGLFVGR